ncbi:MAG: YigZ family protein [Arcobacteraceae bacterium]|nr:YigZ family protein [Arcobacteraceae bacterium]
MFFVEKEFVNTIEVTKSKFSAYLCPYKDFEALMTRLKSTHPKARHFVYAYRFLNEFDQIIENSSDDGEPRGTSGKPTLAVLGGNELINSAIIIVRYFGGTKLGTGGLVRAYSDAANEVIKISTLKEYKKLLIHTIEVDYSELSKLEYTLHSLGLEIISKNFDTKVILEVSGTQEQLNQINSY